MISMFDMVLLSQYERYQGYIFTEWSLPYEGSKSQKNDFKLGFQARVIFI